MNINMIPTDRGGKAINDVANAYADYAGGFLENTVNRENVKKSVYDPMKKKSVKKRRTVVK